MLLPTQISANAVPILELPERREISHVIFDFDGTLSWLRHGWPRIMCEVCREFYPARPGETEAEILDHLLNELLALNGKQTIYQMEKFVSMVEERGGQAPAPEALLEEYLRRLDFDIRERTLMIKNGQVDRDAFVIAGARPLLDELRSRRLTLIILSGTIEHRVVEEAEMLELSGYFGRHIYGSVADPTKFSKRMVIDRILREERIEGRHLLSFGDGPVEIAQTKEVGGLAIAVASDEDVNGSGKLDPHKQQQLVLAGADAVIPDYLGVQSLIRSIFGT